MMNFVENLCRIQLQFVASQNITRLIGGIIINFVRKTDPTVFFITSGHPSDSYDNDDDDNHNHNNNNDDDKNINNNDSNNARGFIVYLPDNNIIIVFGDCSVHSRRVHCSGL